MTLATITSAISLVLAALTLGLVIFNIGKWAGKIEQFEKQLQSVRSEIHNLPTKFVLREVQIIKDEALKSQLIDITAELKSLNKTHAIMAISLAKLDPSGISSSIHKEYS